MATLQQQGPARPGNLRAWRAPLKLNNPVLDVPALVLVSDMARANSVVSVKLEVGLVVLASRVWCLTRRERRGEDEPSV